ncbi:MAG: glycosyltransferase family 39 protein [Gemmatimonadaceae bacterium]
MTVCVRGPESVPYEEKHVTDAVTETVGRPLTRLVLAGALILIAAHAALAWYLRIPGMTTGGDDAWYLLLARSIRAGGYSDTFIVGSPVHSQYPPLYPMLLAIIGMLSGERLNAILAVAVLLSTLTLVLVFDATRRLWSPSLALMALAVTALNPFLIAGAGQIRSETLFLALSMLSLWALARKPAAEHQGLAMGAALAAALTRTVGMTLPIALFLHWLPRRRARTLVVFCVLGALTAGGWLLWSIISPDKTLGNSYIVAATRERPGRHVTMARAFFAYFSRLIPNALPLPTLSGTIVDNVVLVLAMALLAGAGFVLLWRGWRAAALYLAVTMALLVVWPWRYPRFVEPLLPIMLVTILLGAAAIGTRMSARWALALPLAVTGLIGSTALARDAEMVAAWSQCDRSAPTRSSGCFTAAQRSFFALTEHVKAHTPDSAVFAVGKVATFAYLTDRRVVLLKPALNADSAGFLRYFTNNRVTHVVLGKLITTEHHLGRRLLPVCRHLELEAEFPPNTYLFRINASELVTRNTTACAAVERFMANW